MTRFSASKQNRSLKPVYIYLCDYGNGTYVTFTVKNPNYVLLTCLLPFLATKGSRVLEKKISKTQVLNTVFRPGLNVAFYMHQI